MYTHTDIHQKLDAVLSKQGFMWIKNELLYGEVPVVYWSNAFLNLKVQITERQNAVYFEVSKFVSGLPIAPDADWIDLYTFSDEYKRRINMPLSELVKLVPGSFLTCPDQLARAALELPVLLSSAIKEFWS